ncbi:MAG: 6-hydroxymethylpterin diphosphokinase MptE-like protein [Candidatus Hodarchaeota archaeon]
MVSRLKHKLNFYNEFKDFYFQIINDFKFDYQEDCKARDYLSEILSKKNLKWKIEKIIKSFKTLIVSKPVILIYGCGPSLEETVDKILRQKGKNYFDKFINIAANGASVFLREKNITIDAIFTDLDGITRNEFIYSKFNVIHAHGDNIEKLISFEKYILEFENVIGTTQVEPLENVINPGGFTDGDRILYFIHKLLNPSQIIFLIGMDFKNIVGKYSKLDIKNDQEGSLIKKKKLRYAVELLEWIKIRIINEIFFVNSEIVSDKFRYISVRDFIKMNNS